MCHYTIAFPRANLAKQGAINAPQRHGFQCLSWQLIRLSDQLCLWIFLRSNGTNQFRHAS